MRAWIILLLCAGAAHAQPLCRGTLGSNLRMALAEGVRHALRVSDVDRRRVEDAFGVDASTYGGTAIAGGLGGDRTVCPVDRAELLTTRVLGGEVHAPVSDAVEVRALALDNLSVADAGSNDRPEARLRHTTVGAFARYDGWLDAGLVHFWQREATVAGDHGGWMVSAAAGGVRGSVLLGDDDLDAIDIGPGALPLGPLSLGGGLRYLDQEGVATAYLLMEDWLLAGRQRFGVLADSRVELELNTGHLRSATAALKFTGAGRPLPDPETGEMPSGWASILINLHVMGSVFAGSRLDGTEVDVVPGGGLLFEMGGYGRHGALAIETKLWVNEPLAMDYAADPTFTFVGYFMARLRLDFGGS